ncbi:MAG: formylglycine-generating enzyme family protein [Verrucomicrobia bacterium]|nr:formylglycine-generating enzyme family protein [Verrucomicrobiota bacterium]
MKRHEFVVVIGLTMVVGAVGVLHAQSKPQPVSNAGDSAAGLKTNLTLNLGNGIEMHFVLIRPGRFQMGSVKAHPETPLHTVTLTKPFYIGKHEVTQEQWRTVMGNNPSHFKGDKNPVEMTAWEDCQLFLQKLRGQMPGFRFRLPTEAEWEYDCRAGSATEYCYGNNARKLAEYAWFNANSHGTSHPVGEKKANAWGLHDMHGNVWEWCQDWYGNPNANDVTDPVGPRSGSRRMLRGGSWLYSAKECRSFVRDVYTPSVRLLNVGFRVAIGLDRTPKIASDD